MFTLPAVEYCVLHIIPFSLVMGGVSVLSMLAFQPPDLRTWVFLVPEVDKFVLRQVTSNSRATRRRLRGYPRVQLNVQLLLGSQSLDA